MIPHIIRKRLDWLFFLLYSDVVVSLPSWLSQLNWDSQQGRDRTTSGRNNFFWLGQSYSYIMRKVWYHQIWIQKYLGFIVSDLTYMRLHSLLIKASLQAKKQLYVSFWALNTTQSCCFQHVHCALNYQILYKNYVTPLRIPRISGWKSQILKPPFLS